MMRLIDLFVAKAKPGKIFEQFSLLMTEKLSSFYVAKTIFLKILGKGTKSIEPQIGFQKLKYKECQFIDFKTTSSFKKLLKSNLEKYNVILKSF